jgi:hypothetical protein
LYVVTPSSDPHESDVAANDPGNQQRAHFVASRLVPSKSSLKVSVHVPGTPFGPGGVVELLPGGHALVVALTVARADRFPAASTASTPSVYELPHERPATVPCVVEDDDTLVPPR